MQALPSVYWLLLLPALGLLVAFYIWPLVQVLWISLIEISPNAEGLALGNYGLLFTDPGIQRLLWRTARICLITTLITIALGYVVAYAMVHVDTQHRLLLLFGVLLTFWLSVLIRAFAWILLLRSDGVIFDAVNLFYEPLRQLGVVEGRLRLVRSETGVIIGMVHYMLPYAILPLFANMQGIDQRVMLAARGLGAGPFGSFWRVYLPLSLPGLVGATILVLVFSLGFFITPALLGGGRVVMAAEYIYVSMDVTLRWGLATMLATTILAATLALVALMARIVDLRTMFGAK
ncbi:MAG: ABC transporter permease [Geminicoccaceae bacterium]|nr:MAG: ABC transporter permease [Geminicoccaceae bacterium]